MPLQTTQMSFARHILYRVLVSALILLSLLWLALADWPAARPGTPAAGLDVQRVPSGISLQNSTRTTPTSPLSAN